MVGLEGLSGAMKSSEGLEGSDKQAKGKETSKREGSDLLIRGNNTC